MQLGVIVGLLFSLVIAIFAMFNTEAVVVNFYFGQVNATVALVVLGSAAMGALAVGLFGFITQIRTGFTVWEYRNKLGRLTKEVAELQERKQALSDDLSFVNAECEQTLREKEAELENWQVEAEAEAEQKEAAVVAEPTAEQDSLEEEKTDDN